MTPAFSMRSPMGPSHGNWTGSFATQVQAIMRTTISNEHWLVMCLPESWGLFVYGNACLVGDGSRLPGPGL
eukprot:15467503-Alexandrium_andersonii.AAC.1